MHLSMTLTADQILALAPDPASAKAGSAQSSLTKWSGLGGHAQALWGLCQGSGKEPYKAQIELAGPSFKCTCPSRKFPCKHGLGLYLLYAREGGAFVDSEAPAWVTDWLQSREQRSEKKAAKLAEAETEQTPEELAAKAQSQQKRQEKRQGNVESGLALLETWLADLARDGLAGLRSRPAKDWDAIAARLVDTQASGLASRLRRTGLRVYGSSLAGWEVSVARELAQIALLSHSYRRLDTLPSLLQHDLKSAIGWQVSQDEVLQEPGQADLWQVCGNLTQDDERISRRACYLRGRHSGRWAMLLQFSAGAQPLPPPLLLDTCHQGSLHYYPSALPLRVAFGGDVQLVRAAPPAAAAPSDFAALLTDYAQALAVNPFIETYPMLLEHVAPQAITEPALHFMLSASDGAMMPVDPLFRHGWHLHALTGGSPATIFGLWSGYAFFPLSVSVDGRVHALDGEQAR
jgi:hypothetical protein